MADGDFNLIETGESTEPSYDQSTGKMHDPELDGGKGGTRDATVEETVRAAVRVQQAQRDPISRYRQQAQKNNTSLERVLERVEEFDNASARDPVDGFPLLAT